MAAGPEAEEIHADRDAKQEAAGRIEPIPLDLTGGVNEYPQQQATAKERLARTSFRRILGSSCRMVNLILHLSFRVQSLNRYQSIMAIFTTAIVPRTANRSQLMKC